MAGHMFAGNTSMDTGGASDKSVLTSGLADLKRKHELYRKARERAAAAGTPDRASFPAPATPSGTIGSSVAAAPANADAASTPARPPSRGAEDSLRKLRGAHAAQQVAAKQAEEEKKAIEKALHEAQEQAARMAARQQDELQQERARRAAAEQESRQLQQVGEVHLATAQQKLQTASLSAKKEASALQATLIDAVGRVEELELEKEQLHSLLQASPE